MILLAITAVSGVLTALPRPPLDAFTEFNAPR
jgi:hypothetical protein